MVVFTNRDAASPSRVARAEFAGDRFAEHCEFIGIATANELVVDPFGVIPRFLARLYYLIH